MDILNNQDYQLHNARFYILKALTIQSVKTPQKIFTVDQLLSLWLFDKSYVTRILENSTLILHDGGATYEYFKGKFSPNQQRSLIEIARDWLIGKEAVLSIPGLNFLKNVKLFTYGVEHATAYTLHQESGELWSEFNQLLDFLTMIVFLGVIKLEEYPAVFVETQQDLIFTGTLPTQFFEWWRQ